MKKFVFFICSWYKNFKNPIIYIFDKIYGLSIICEKYDSKYEKIFQEEKSIVVLKTVWLKIWKSTK